MVNEFRWHNYFSRDFYLFVGFVSTEGLKDAAAPNLLEGVPTLKIENTSFFQGYIFSQKNYNPNPAPSFQNYILSHK